jgi:oligoendopeptidase F
VTPASTPSSPDSFRDATLESVLPYFRELAERPLDDPAAWLADWSDLECLFDEASVKAQIAAVCDTADEAKRADELRFTSDIAPHLEPWRVKLGERLVASGFTAPGLETTIQRLRNRIALFRDENVPLVAELERLGSEHRRIVGGLTSEWEGERLTPPQLRPFAASEDRAVRERAFRAFFRPYIEARDELAGLYTQMLDLRGRMARNAGFASYRDFGHQQLNRFDYSPADCLRWHDAVEATVVPAIRRIYARRARLMGLDSDLIRPWDAIDSHVASPDPLGRPPVRPFGTADELVAGSLRVFEQVDATIGSQIRRMVEAGSVDLMSRPNKASGAFCATLPYSRLPFVFANSVGIAGDVDTFLHECGHAVHAFEATEHLPLMFEWDPGSEMAEVASMSMELLARPYLARARGGFYDDGDMKRTSRDHLEEILVGLGHIAAVDAFQHWAYTSADAADPDLRDRQWLELRDHFEAGVDWSGCEAERVARWYEQPHFFDYPLYYIEYGLAQLGALQVWRNARRDQAGAVAAYRRALALGGTRPLPELFAAAGAELVFSAEAMAPLVEEVEEELERLRE